MKKLSFNKKWIFFKEGEDAKAKIVNLPHDAMLEEKRDGGIENGCASGFFPGGKYVYVKSINGDQLIDKCVILEFEGVYMDSTVYLNGQKVGGHYYGYTAFTVDISGKIKAGENEIRVVVDNSKTPNSRWYTGSGIYRNVNLYVSGKAHIFPHEVKVKTLSINPTNIQVCTAYDGSGKIQITVYKNGEQVACGAGDRCVLNIENAELWSAENPALYQIKIELKEKNKVLDENTLYYGIRVIESNAKNGLLINGKIVKLRGGCLHHDNGLLGARASKKADYRKIKRLKELGYNAVRFSHYPASEDFLSVCDELGMYVLDESFDQWHLPQTKYDYSTHFDDEWQGDLFALILKDFNHPSVILYSIGNEITDVGQPGSSETCEDLACFVRELDSSRPIVLANNCLLTAMSVAVEEARKNGENKKDVSSSDANEIVALLPHILTTLTAEKVEKMCGDVFKKVDIVGYNYNENLYEDTHALVPDRVILSSETFPSRIGKNWTKIKSLPYVIGDFMWTAWDYIGEAGVGQPFYGSEQAPFSKPYPCMLAGCGSVDILGNTESQGYYTAVVFGATDKPHIAVRPVNHSGEPYTVGKWRLTDAIDSWSWDGCEGKTAQIEIYGAGNSVELYLNGELLGRENFVDCRALFETPYRKGELKAIMKFEDGKQTECVLRSADAETIITAGSEDKLIKCGGEDYTYINIAITDKNGIVKSLCDRKVTVKVEGAGKLFAVGSGNPSTEESYLGNSCTTYYGKAQAIIYSGEQTGEIKVTISSDGLSDKIITLNCGEKE